MAKEILTLSDLGYDECWLLIQQACGIPDARARSSFLENMTTVLFFGKESIPDRLCFTAAVRQMGGHVVYVAPGGWEDEAMNFPLELSVVANYYVDITAVYGLPIASMRVSSAKRQRPLINAGSPDGHPIHALADLACMQHYTPDFSQVVVGWVGCANGPLHSLMEAAAFFPFTLQIALPEGTVPASLRQAEVNGAKIKWCKSPQEAATGAHYICAGCLGNELRDNTWAITPELMSVAAYKARILLSASPLNSTPIDKDLLQSKASLLHKQAENRLRVNKRMLHWVFGEN